jgi:hypothetical protein
MTVKPTFKRALESLQIQIQNLKIKSAETKLLQYSALYTQPIF